MPDQRETVWGASGGSEELNALEPGEAASLL